MAIYVDQLFEHPKRNAEGNLWCHMRADSLEELHQFAFWIGRKRCWFHSGDHYDLTPSFRAKAIAAGAIELTPLEFSTLAIRATRTANNVRPALGHIYRCKNSSFLVEAQDDGHTVRMWDPLSGVYVAECKPFEFDRNFEWMESTARFKRRIQEAS